jgi:molybdopterin molybdotransferase
MARAEWPAIQRAGYYPCMSSAASREGIVSFERARRVVDQHAAGVRCGDVETVDLLAGSGRVLAEEIVADRDFPPFNRATRDGYAVRAEDVAEIPARLEVVGEVKAGDRLEAGVGTVGRGQAVEIMTGAPVPAGADAVVMVEHTAIAEGFDAGRHAGKFVDVERGVGSGANLVARGAEARAGQRLLNRGRRLDSAAVAIAAAVGKSRVQVFRRPRVAVLATGDELVEIEATPGASQIRNSNSYSLAAQVQAAGGEAVRLAVAPDERRRLRELIEEGLRCDLLLLTGGVSMGKYDLVEAVLGELKADFYFTGAEIQPGRPVVFGSCSFDDAGTRARAPAPHRKYFFGLPGNPVSTMVTFELFVRPMMEALGGQTAQRLIFLRARLRSEIRTKTGLKRFLPGVVSGEFETAEVELARWQGSGDIAALAGANCYVVIPADRERIEAGEWVAVMIR